MDLRSVSGELEVCGTKRAGGSSPCIVWGEVWASVGRLFDRLVNFSSGPGPNHPVLRPPMDALLAKADAIRPYKKRKFSGNGSDPKNYTGKKEAELDPTIQSVLHRTSLPKSLRPGLPPPEGTRECSHVSDKKLRAELSRQSALSARSKVLLEDAAFLLEHEEPGTMEVEGELERTWRVGQGEITESAGQEAAKGRREWKLDGGPYRSRYTRNGRYMHHIQYCVWFS